MPKKTKNDLLTIHFWGVRGTLAVPGKKTLRYGGNTNCLSLSIKDKPLFIFDAGTGIKELSNYFINKNMLPVSAKIFITHPHYDHINGIPFFAPLYMPGNQFELFGTNHGNINIESLISNQMDSVYFPVTINDFAATLTFHSIQEEEEFSVDGVTFQTISLNHPGKCIGYRVNYKNKSFCYITDNELYLEDSPQYDQQQVDKLVQFIAHTDVLVMDSTYSEQEYLKKIGWGHSCISRVVDIADKAKAKLLCLFHHDPDQYDKDIDLKLKQAKALLKMRHSKTRCIAPAEGKTLIF